jgi:NADPH:quinone reductase-like Zn-dependent oxidoreductase
MKAATFDRFGNPQDVLQIQERPKPVPGRGEVLVRMIASPVNPSDLMYIEGRYGLQPKQWPATPGFEGLGVVEANGGGLLGMLRKGKRVAVLNGGIGNWSEYTVTTARQVIPVPADIPDDQAATFFVNPATALGMTRYVLQVPQGEWLLQSAAGSALGKMVIRLGKKFGFRTVNTVRRREQVDELKKLGADLVLCEADGPIDVQVRQHIPGGVKFAMDPVGGTVAASVIRSLADGGRCLLFGSLAAETIEIDPRFLISGNKRVEGFWLGEWAKRQSVIKMLRLIREVRGLMREGVLSSDIAKTYPLDQVRDAVAEAARPGKPGKVLLRIG